MSSETQRQKLITYFMRNLSKGYTADTLKYALLNQGYPRTSVESAIKEAHIEMAKHAPVLKEKPEIKYELVEEVKPVEEKSWWRRLFGL